MKRVLFAPHGPSNGAKALARGLGGKTTKAEKSLKRDVILVNWGRSDLSPKGTPYRVINNPRAIATASNKLTCFQALRARNVPSVDFTADQSVVRKWLREGHVVYGRRLLNSSQGKGIVVIENLNQMVPCPLYTKGILKAHEYRVHVFGSKIIDVTKKRRRADTETNDFIKNLENGWVYCRDGVEVPDEVITASRNAVAAVGLDFGAVDLLYRKGEPYVLEINTAPGLEGTTLEKYIEEFSKLKRL